MTSMRRFLRKVRLLFGREKFRDELNEEMAFHRAEAEREFVDGGMSVERLTTQRSGSLATRRG